MSRLKIILALMGSAICSGLIASDVFSDDELLSYEVINTCRPRCSRGTPGDPGERGDQGKKGKKGPTGATGEGITQPQFQSQVFNLFSPLLAQVDQLGGATNGAASLPINVFLFTPPAIITSSYEGLSSSGDGVLDATFNIPVNFLDNPTTTTVILHFVTLLDNTGAGPLGSGDVVFNLQTYYAAPGTTTSVTPKDNLITDQPISVSSSDDPTKPWNYYTTTFTLATGLLPNGLLSLFLVRVNDSYSGPIYITSIEFRYQVNS